MFRVYMYHVYSLYIDVFIEPQPYQPPTYQPVSISIDLLIYCNIDILELFVY